MDIEELLKDGDTEELRGIIRKYFNDDSELFFNYVIDEGLSKKDEFDVTLAELFPNMYLSYYYYKVNRDAVKEYVAERLSDVVKKDGKYYMVLNDYTDLAGFFEDSRNSPSTKYLESVISGESDYYSDYVQDIGSSLVDDLTPENRQKLIEKIKEDGLNQEIEYNGGDGLIESFIDADGNSSTFILTTERLNQIIADKGGLYELLSESDNFLELHQEMNRFYNWAHDQATADEIYVRVMNEIANYFEVDRKELGKWESFTRTRYDGHKVTEERYLVNVDKIFGQSIEDSFDSTRYWNSDDNQLIDYHGGLESFLKDETRGPTIYLDNVYPDWRNLEEIYNSHFSDNI